MKLNNDYVDVEVNSNDFNNRNLDSSKSKQTRKQGDPNHNVSKQEGSKTDNYNSILIHDPYAKSKKSEVSK